MNWLAWGAAWRERLRLYVQARPGTRALAANSSWLVADRVVRAALLLAVGAWIARVHGPSVFGQYTYALTFVALFLGIANLGANELVVRDLAHAPQHAAHTLGTVFVLRLATGLLCWALAVLSVHLLRPQDAAATRLVALVGMGLVLQATDTVDLWLQSQSRNQLAVSAKLIACVAGNLIRIGLVIAQAPLWALALSVALDAALTSLALGLAYRRAPSAGGWRFDQHFASSLLRQSWPFMLSGVAVLVYMRIDQLMIREMLGDAALGLYSSAATVSQMWYFVPVALCTALAPHIARKKQQHDDAAYMLALERVFRLFAVGSLALTLATMLMARPLIHMFYGPDYAAAAPILAIHVWSNVFVFLGVAQGLWLVNERLGRLTLYRTLLGAGASVVGNLVLIPLWGLEGAALSTVLAMFLSAVASNAVLAPNIFALQLRAFLPVRAWRRAS
jgi:O-antigen/teichoic acid export membrane protein